MTDATKHTPRRTFRIPDAVYVPAQEKAAKRGETLTDVVTRALDKYGRSK